MPDHPSQSELLDLTAEIVSAHASNNTVAAEDLPHLIKLVHSTLSSLGGEDAGKNRPTPAVSIEDSIQDDYLVCLEDGKKLKMLKRHLKSAYDMSPEEYREKWGLRADYPMVAPNYAKQRSSLAKDFGLGRSKKAAPKRKRK